VRELKALLFDVDGTLADTERDGHRVAFNRAFQDAGLTWEWSVELYGELLAVTGGKERIRFFIDRWNPEVPDVEDLDAFIAGLHRDKTRHYTAALEQGGIPLRPGVLRIIQEARDAGLTLGVATTTTPANVTALITHSIGPGAMDWFSVLAAGDVVPAKKPAPDIYIYAMEKLGLRPDECMAFEDSVHGLHSARDAGIDTVVITVNGYTADQDFTGASLVLDGLGEPEAAATRLQGDLPFDGCFGLDDLRRLHALWEH
jgi:HAD superfamily hydrolase (TIGR01509 family)